MIGYLVWVALGIAAAAGAARWQGDVSGLGPDLRSRLLLAAAGGAILGAFLLQLPADLLGWSAPPPAHVAGDALPLGGRTVLGGLLGGWLAVEWAKRRLAVRQPTGDGFALPLALALGCGRIGCMTAGCCAGEACAPAWWAWVDAAGTARVPVQAIEATFHFGIAGWLAFRIHRRRPVRGTSLAVYLAALALLRLVLESWREHPPILFGLGWYQWLAVALLALAAGTWWRRRQSGADPAPADGEYPARTTVRSPDRTG